MSSYKITERESAASELRSTAARLALVLAVAVIVALAARLTMGPPLF